VITEKRLKLSGGTFVCSVHSVTSVAKKSFATVHGLSGSYARQRVDALRRSLHRLATVATNGNTAEVLLFFELLKEKSICENRCSSVVKNKMSLFYDHWCVVRAC